MDLYTPALYIPALCYIFMQEIMNNTGLYNIGFQLAALQNTLGMECVLCIILVLCR